MEEADILAIAMKVHGFCGAVALLVAPIAMVVHKGSDAHRLWGKVFFYAMVVVCLTAIYVGFTKPNYVMALVAFFSFHMIASGYRALYLKKLHEGLRPARMDVLLHGTALVVNMGLLIWGLGPILLKTPTPFSYIFTVFGIIGVFNVFRVLRRFLNPRVDRRQWVFDHMTGFIGGYIATVSAFSAVNLEFLPTIVRWLWPTVIGVPLLLLWGRSYRRKFDAGARMKKIADVRIR